MSNCKYCQGGRIAVEPGSSTSYPCPDCRNTDASVGERLFWPVSGSDFARSIKWAKGQVNPVAQAIKVKVKAK